MKNGQTMPAPHLAALCSTTTFLGCSWEWDGGAWRALFAHGCLLTICKCKTGPEGVEIFACGGVRGAQGLLTASCWHPQLRPLFPSLFVPSWALSKRGCLLTPGLAALFVPLTFSSLYAGPFYGGFKGGSEPPPPPPPPPLPAELTLVSRVSLLCSNILAVPTGDTWVALGDSSCVTCPVLPHCLAPPAALGTCWSGCERLLATAGFPALCTL